MMACTGVMSLGFPGENKKDRMLQRQTVPLHVTGSPVAVLELFTSEGCSSCPPADDLLPQLANINPAIIPLSFHVDYWNDLGWTDPFSSSVYSERQREYVTQFKLESAYTPQLVINGEYEMVGSNRGKAEKAIREALKENAAVQLSISQVSQTGDKLHFTVGVTGDRQKTRLEALLVQGKAVMKIKAGENNGATLTHTNIVRSILSKEKPETVNQFEMVIPQEAGKDNWKIVALSRRTDDLRINGAVLYTGHQD